ncbi:nuclear transport factor 2 family protein [uncultured Kocuria sp.]|uniref:nuclear transport factor 2 family protein n=1 Tax=uncultured Kocuria sp. TaxID=259305 RepID=UPI002626E05D|nr:nuclear transport factor 2 family protein [uncultured Kocuria sp.]
MDDARISERTTERTPEQTIEQATEHATEGIAGAAAEQAPGTAPGTISAQDRIEINEILSFSSHLLDNRRWDMFGEVFVPEVHLSAPQGEFTGPAGVRRFVETVDLSRFPATHTLNSIVEAVDADTAVAWSRMLLLTWDRRVACGDYIDTFRRTAHGWRIERRTVAPRNDSASVALAEGGYAPDPYAYAMFDDAVLAAVGRARR